MFEDSSNKLREKIANVNSDNIAPSPSERVAREEINKLRRNSEEIRKIKDKIEKKSQ